MKIPRIAYAAYGFAVLVIVLDQLTKAWVVTGLELPEVGRIVVWDPVFSLTWVRNFGVSFGLFGDGSARWLLTVFSLGVSVFLAVWATRADRRLLIAAIGLVMGGALGNVIDRIRYGYVVDFLDFSGLYFPWVFNVADAAINVGIVLLILDAFLSERGARAADQRKA
ncbi:MAG: signal peptidase II [Brevundimonas sp.]|jgi:signal peptidase II|uniref:signal peptidase II n=1 Tax=Brevundimonas sp. TaxID=1871086 RepID=UPI00184C1F2A|nr:signal peptidase II [Brevundimonas sp.]MBA4805788.1 signal peptidase II [Brevundimonas sp.]